MTPWTPENVDLLRQLWAAGKTAGEISKALGGEISRDAVIGKAHRLKLAKRKSPIIKNRGNVNVLEKFNSLYRTA